MDLAGFKVTRKQFDEAFPGPQKFKYIVYPYFNSGEFYIHEFFPSFSTPTTIEGLPGFRAMSESGPQRNTSGNPK
jgi:hypothetical protein